MSAGIKDIGLRLDEFCRKFRNSINLIRKRAPIDDHVLTLDEAGLPKSFKHRNKSGLIASTQA
jgi:hypothetical protein